MSPFKVLGISDEATVQEVKSKFRELARTHHPDRGGNAAEFIKYQQAYALAVQLAEQPLECEECEGAGKIELTRGFSSTKLKCPACNGSGTKERGA